MDPIVLTKFGEVLIPPSDATDSSFLGRTSECARLGVCVIGTFGVYVGGKKVYMEIADPKGAYWAIYCPTRALRVRVPKTINTYGELRQWFADKMSAERVEAREVSMVLNDHMRYGSSDPYGVGG